MTKVDNRDRALTEDDGTRLEMMGWYGGGKPKDPCRNKFVTELGTKGVKTIWEQYQVNGTYHNKRMMLHPTRNYAS
jgi:hypothetical protein